MADINIVRDQLPGVTDTVYLNTGTCGPLPLVAYEAMREEMSHDLTKARIDSDHFPSLGRKRNEVREAVASYVGAVPSRSQ